MAAAAGSKREVAIKRDLAEGEIRVGTRVMYRDGLDGFCDGAPGDLGTIASGLYSDIVDVRWDKNRGSDTPPAPLEVPASPSVACVTRVMHGECHSSDGECRSSDGECHTSDGEWAEWGRGHALVREPLTP